MFKFVNNLAPEYCCNMFTLVTSMHDRNTRSADDGSLAIPRINLMMGQRNIRYFGVKIWHNLDPQITSEGTLEGFKKAIYSK